MAFRSTENDRTSCTDNKLVVEFTARNIWNVDFVSSAIVICKTEISQKNNNKFFNPLPVQFKALLPAQKGCVFFSGHLNLPTTPEIGLPSREKNHNN